jgi:hypothetical protein
MPKKRVALSSTVALPLEANTVAAPAPSAAYGDINALERYSGLSRWTIRTLIRQGVLPPGVSLTGTSKKIWKFASVDAAFEKARRSRRPKPRAKGFFARERANDAQQSELNDDDRSA